MRFICTPRGCARVALALCALAATTPALALDTRLITSGLDSPVFLTAPAGDTRLFVVERNGLIKVGSGGSWSTFLDLSGQVDTAGERGLLGLAFDPNYRSNGTFYVDYVDKKTENTHIARFTVSGNANLANPTGTNVLTIQQPPGQNNHKAGWIGFRPGEANNLYIATGDGGGGNDLRPDPNFDNNAQNKNRLLGKMLRIDVHPSNPNQAYSIPSGNPFANGGGAAEVWDYGLRNPYRNSFDRTKGNLIIADVGQDAREEVDFETASSKGGANFGWRVREGKDANPLPDVGGPKTPGMQDPVYDYAHGNGPLQGESIIGGYVYRGSLLKGIQGQYFFGDFVNGRVWSMQTDPVTGALLPATIVDRTAELKRLNDFQSISSFGEDGFGNLFIVDFNGKVLQVVPEPGTYAFLLGALAVIGVMTRRRMS
jgi:glucose/arabinose dehydrogenase